MNINLYISYIPNWVTKQQLYDTCKRLNEFVPLNIVLNRNPDSAFSTAYIFIKKWHITKYSNKIRKQLLNGETIYLLYSFPMYLKCSLLKKNNDNNNYKHGLQNLTCS